MTPAKTHHRTNPAPLGPMTGQDWLRRFERFADKLAKTREAQTGYALPGNQGLSVDAAPAVRNARAA